MLINSYVIFRFILADQPSEDDEKVTVSLEIVGAPLCNMYLFITYARADAEIVNEIIKNFNTVPKGKIKSSILFCLGGKKREQFRLWKDDDCMGKYSMIYLLYFHVLSSFSI